MLPALTVPSLPSPHASAGASLTRQELACLECSSRGMTYRGIAREMGISVHTVNAHLVHVRAKLDVSETSMAVVFALHLHLIPDPLPNGPCPTA